MTRAVSRRRPGRRRVALALLLACAPASGIAQTPANAESTGPRLFKTSDLYWTAGFAGLTAAALPKDRQLARTLRGPALQANRLLARGSAVAAPLGSPGGKLVGPVLYGVGRLTGSRDIARTGLHTAEAVLITTLITDGIKVAAGRARPSVSPDDPYQFRLMGGLEGNARRSFPSGHASGSFAVTAEVGYSVRGSRAFVAPILFGTASAVGLSRMYDNQHWASDVIVGAALGTLAGYKVARYTHQHPGNTVDTALLGREEDDDRSGTSASIQRRTRGTVGGGIPITFSIPAP